MTSKAHARFVIAALFLTLVVQYEEYFHPESIDDPTLQLAIRLATMPYLPDEPAGSGVLPIAYRPALAVASAASLTNVDVSFRQGER
jgi:hypothetical protein